MTTTQAMLGIPENLQHMPLQQELAQVAAFNHSEGSFFGSAWNLDYMRMYERLKRDAFFRSCSQHWLDAMLDVELGVER